MTSLPPELTTATDRDSKWGPQAGENAYRWATVTGLTPLRIRMDGEEDPLLLTPDCLADLGQMVVGDRVWVQLFKRRVIILGVSGGGGGPGGGGPPTGPASGDLTGSYPGPQIATDAVGSNEIAPDAVGSSEIAPGAVGNSELASEAVTGAKIADGQVANQHLVDNTITSAKIADGTLTAADFAPGVLSPGGLVLAFPSPLTSWIGMHNLNQKPVDVTLMDAAGNKFLGNVTFPDVNTVQASFSVAVAGSMLIQK